MFSILVGAGFGYGFDRHFETEPWGLLVGLAVGFAAFVLRLVRLARQLEAANQSNDAKDAGGEGTRDTDPRER